MYKTYIFQFCNALVRKEAIYTSFTQTLYLQTKYSTTGTTKYSNTVQNKHMKHSPNTVNPQKRPAGLIFSLRVQTRVLLEFGCFCLLFFEITAGLIRIRVLFEGGSLSRIYGT